VAAAEIALELPGDGVAARFGQVGRVLGFLERPDVVRDLGVLLRQLVDTPFPRPGLLGQVAQRQRHVQDVLDPPEQGQGGFGAGRLGHIVGHGRPE
jgi:hypothetical protein